jgi:hypothetical protein
MGTPKQLRRPEKAWRPRQTGKRQTTTQKETSKNMTLGREDLLVKHHSHRLHANTNLCNGYIVTSTDPNILTIVLFYGENRLKGYITKTDALSIIEKRSDKAIIKSYFPKR